MCIDSLFIFLNIHRRDFEGHKEAVSKTLVDLVTKVNLTAQTARS